jgi:hypothetical protein
MKLLRMMVLIVLLLGLSACKGTQQQTPTPEPQTEIDTGDGGLISGEPCGPPCFMGFSPGVSSESDVIDSLASRGILPGCKQEYSILCPNLRLVIRMEVDRRVVKDISYPPTKVYLGDLITKFGAPDGWALECAQDEVANVHCPPVWLDLFYTDLHMIVSLEVQEQKDATYEAMSESMIETVLYTSESLNNWVFISPWHGYGEYRRP